MTRRFNLFIGIDWSGAKGLSQRGIAVAACRPGRGAPELVPPPEAKRWSRPAVISYLCRLQENERVLCGFDFSFGFPFKNGAFFPANIFPAGNAKEFWREVDTICETDPHLYAGSFISHSKLKKFFITKKGESWKKKFRKTEQAWNNPNGSARAESVFHLVGPSQVGKASLSGMRALLRLPGYAVWPFDEIDPARSVIVEIFTRIFLSLGGHDASKIRTREDLNKTLSHLSADPIESHVRITDHDGDALASAAGLRLLSNNGKYWNPKGLTENIRLTEGWTFGVP